ncbi:MAG TPA: hypothetical protein VHO06_04635 [Polyangia bacterium]|nr:hypothetical protein [Polyangia bacterium]
MTDTPPPKTDFRTALLNRISPRVFGLLLAVVMLMLVATTGYAIFTGRSLDFWGLKIGAGTPPAKPPEANGTSDEGAKAGCQREAAAASKRAEEAERKLGEAIAQRDIPNLWPAGKPKSEVIPTLIQAGQECDDDGMADCLYAKIENQIGKYSGFIDVQHAPKDLVTMIQRALQSCGALDGDLDGDAIRTRAALLKFQKSQHIRSNEDAYEGKFGMKTLNQIRKRHKEISDGA